MLSYLFGDYGLILGNKNYKEMEVCLDYLEKEMEMGKKSISDQEYPSSISREILEKLKDEPLAAVVKDVLTDILNKKSPALMIIQQVMKHGGAYDSKTEKIITDAKDKKKQEFGKIADIIAKNIGEDLNTKEGLEMLQQIFGIFGEQYKSFAEEMEKDIKSFPEKKTLGSIAKKWTKH